MVSRVANAGHGKLVSENFSGGICGVDWGAGD